MCEFQLSIAYKLTYINSIFSAVVVMEKEIGNLFTQPAYHLSFSSIY